MDFWKVPLPASKLRKIPPGELLFLVQMCHLTNEIHMLYRLLMLVVKHSGAQEEGVSEARVAHSLMIARFLAGRLYEGNDLIQHAYFKTKVSLALRDELSDEAKEALDYIKAYFKAKPNGLKRARLFAFHTLSDEMEVYLKSLPRSFKSSILLAETGGNVLYYFAEELVNRAQLNAVGRTDYHKKFHIFLDDAADLAREFLKFGEEASYLIIKRYLGKTVMKQKANSRKVKAETEITKAYVPMFLTFATDQVADEGDDGLRLSERLSDTT